MKKRQFSRILAVVCLCALLLTGCAEYGDWIWQKDPEPDATQSTQGVSGDRYSMIPDFSDMVYTRPDMEEYQRLVDTLCETAKVSTSAEQLVDLCMDVYNAYDSFYTMQVLADIRYCLDLSDSYYSAEYDYCTAQSTAVEQGLEACHMALAQSPIVDELESEKYFGAGAFDSYQGDSFYTEELTALMDRENALISESYTVMNKLNGLDYYSDEYFEEGVPEMGRIFLDLVAVRQEIAAYLGLESYGEYAFTMYHDRDYTQEQAEQYLDAIQEKMVPLYRQLNGTDFWTDAYGYGLTERECQDYLKGAVDAMGGKIRGAYRLMDQKHLYDLTPSTNKYVGSFETYITDFGVPYVFINPYGDRMDCLTFAHEFGHFVSDYYSGGASYTKDVSEFFSQGMEYLSLCYAQEDETLMEELRQLKMADSLSTYVEQAAYAQFENEIYKIPAEELTVERVGELYREICTEYGFDSWNWDSRDWITINHLFIAPFYVVSYVTSNDIAMQLYELELEEAGAGLELFEEFAAGCPGQLIAFTQEAGLESPFQQSHLEEVCETFQTVLNLS